MITTEIARNKERLNVKNEAIIAEYFRTEDDIMDYYFEKALEIDVAGIVKIIEDRIEWMNREEIHQWNETKYFDVYPQSYFCKLVKQGELFVLRSRSKGTIVGVAGLFTEDPRWEKISKEPSYYVHHLATALKKPGLGKLLLKFIEMKAEKDHRTVRLDCAKDNPFLNTYYSELGYRHVGTCVDGLYTGNLRQKRLG